MKFAVIEDSRSQAEVLKAILKSDGHQVAVFSDGRSCIEALKTQSFDFFALTGSCPIWGVTKCSSIFATHWVGMSR